MPLVFHLACLGARRLAVRAGSSATLVLGVAGVAFVFATILSLAVGFERALTDASSPLRAVLIRPGTLLETNSWFSGEEVGAVVGRDGVAAVSAEKLVALELALRRTDANAAATRMRGVTADALAVRPEFAIVAGRTFAPGRREAIVGAGAAAAFAGTEIGSVIRHIGLDWTVVGHFDLTGTPHDAEVWADLGVLQNAYGGGVSVAWIRLDDAARLAAVAAEIEDDPSIMATVVGERDFRQLQGGDRAGDIRRFALLVGLMMGVGAIALAVHFFAAHVAAQRRDLGTMRAFGFGAVPVVASQLTEAGVLGAAGGLVGVGLAKAVFQGTSTTTVNPVTLTQVPLSLALPLDACALTVLCGLGVGIVGAVVPSVRLCTMNIGALLKG